MTGGRLLSVCTLHKGGFVFSLLLSFFFSFSFFVWMKEPHEREVTDGKLRGSTTQAGSFVVSRITSTWATWVSLTLLLAVHLGTNFKAVNSVALRTLNRQRANIVFSTLSDSDAVVTPAQAAKLERIFEKDGVLRWRDSEILGYASIGVRLTEFVNTLGGVDASIAGYSASLKKDGGIGAPVSIDDIASVFRNEKYLLWYDSRKQWVTICLRNGITPEEQLKAWVHALFVAKEVRHQGAREKGDGKLQTTTTTQQQQLSKEALLTILETTLHDLGMSFTNTVERLKEAGWDLGTAVLETKPGYRVGICSVEIPDAGGDKAEIRSEKAKKNI